MDVSERGSRATKAVDNNRIHDLVTSLALSVLNHLQNPDQLQSLYIMLCGAYRLQWVPYRVKSVSTGWARQGAMQEMHPARAGQLQYHQPFNAYRNSPWLGSWLAFPQTS